MPEYRLKNEANNLIKWNFPPQTINKYSPHVSSSQSNIIRGFSKYFFAGDSSLSHFCNYANQREHRYLIKAEHLLESEGAIYLTK